MKCKICNDVVFADKLCRRHFNKSVQVAIKMIESVRKRDKGYEPMRIKETVGIFG